MFLQDAFGEELEVPITNVYEVIEQLESAYYDDDKYTVVKIA